MAESTQPRYLTRRQAQILKDTIRNAIGAAERALISDGADPKCFDHEIGLELARAACRLDLDLLAGASSTIERLEAVVAELGGKLEQAKIATGHTEGAIASPLPTLAAFAGDLVRSGVFPGPPNNGDRYRYMAPEHARAEAQAVHRAGIENGTASPHERGCLCDLCRPLK